MAVLTHDPVLDDPALVIALRSPAMFVGGMGSRRNQERRRARLMEEHGLSAEEVESIATLPPTDVLRGQVLAAIIGPVTGLLALVSAPLQSLHGLIDARIEQLGGAGAAPAAEAPAAEEAPEAAPVEEEPAAEAEEPTQADATAPAAETDVSETEEA